MDYSNITIYDISNELFSAKVFPGDPVPEKEPVLSIEKGDVCNLTHLELGSHNGTHMDAPRHFYKNGRAIDELELSKCVGPCTVLEHHGLLTEREIESIAAFSQKRLLIKGDIIITAGAAKALVKYGFLFIGVEGLTVGAPQPEVTVESDLSTDPPIIHRILLDPSAEIVIAENLNLTQTPVGEYLLVCVPLKIEGLDGAPCRPILIQ